ncbi:Carboxypeptidase C (Cathepsin A) [Paraburkholderia ribeironis]|uniref:Carboxypeptidase C (Cathepsin A) n=1 Tax=Paraburkholderia ribeironis TaxID=1247936 RepID=A0A1N7SQ83_9BURK|nr:peptidase S10 [Paraburkholderia ribeironis]SIT49549.1 Carboxypeptidase C (Cathepsin A) [Paraburkholderia ribeironis]
MTPDRSFSRLLPRRARGFAGTLALVAGVLMLAGCGGGDSSSASSATDALRHVSANQQDAEQPQASNRPYVDPVAYSMNAKDGLPASQVAEKAAVMHHQWKSGKTTISYTTTTGHLTAADANGNPEATMSYVAYTAPGTNGAPRPITFLYNGGPGSSSIWLRLGSFAPTRVATPDPLLTNWPNYPLVDNAESLIDTTDMVFIDPPGTGLSEAILPNINQQFWGCDSDVSVMRDFIIRYLAANSLSHSPVYLYGESYGTPRTDMLALALETADVPLTGIVLQSSILNYFADAIEAVAITLNTEGLRLDTDTLAGYYPGYAEVAAYHNQASPPLIDQGLFAYQSQIFATGQYQDFRQYAQTWVLSQLGTPDALGTPVLPPTRTLQSWQWPSGLTLQALQGYFSINPFNTSLIPGTTIGRYDGRVSLPNSDPRLQNDPDPSDILIAQPFTTVLATQMPDYLGYTAPNATYLPLNDRIIDVWDFSHDGEPLPDTLPDLLAAITLNPQLKILAENGFHDLATPFFTTEKELARLQTVRGLNPDLQVNFFQGGHMTYLDDVARPKMKRDLVNYYAGQPVPLALSLWTLPAPWQDESSPGTPTATAQVAATQ